MNAWLIERADDQHPGCTTGACLGVTDRGKIENLNWRTEWTTPDFALRFARKEDAEKAAHVLCPQTKVLIVGHSWDVERVEPLKSREEKSKEWPVSYTPKNHPWRGLTFTIYPPGRYLYDGKHYCPTSWIIAYEGEEVRPNAKGLMAIQNTEAEVRALIKSWGAKARKAKS